VSVVNSRVAVVFRVIVEALLSLTGLLDLRPLFATRKRRPQIAFQAYAEHLALFYAPIIERIRQEAPDVEIHFIVLSHPQFTVASWLKVRRFARESLSIPASNIRFFWQALWHRYDVLICTDVYARFPLRRPRTILLKHGAGVASRILKPHWLRKTIDDFDLVLVNGEADREVLQRYAENGGRSNNVIAVGLPYLDRLHTCTETREAYRRRIGIATDKKVVCVGPSWRGLQAIQSRDPRYFEDLIAALKEHDWEVVIKMHTCSFNKAMVDGDDWAARVARMARQNVHVDFDVDDVPAFLHADMLITDISSRAFDFMLLDKPVIVVIPAGLFTDSLDIERIDLLRKGARFVESATELGPAISQGFDDGAGDGMRSDRRHLIARVFSNPGRAAEVVVGHLLRQLNPAAVA
jgi:CDP-glycerol glycerophosphotransferase (TagB/SpsB family)